MEVDEKDKDNDQIGEGRWRHSQFSSYDPNAFAQEMANIRTLSELKKGNTVSEKDMLNLLRSSAEYLARQIKRDRELSLRGRISPELGELIRQADTGGSTTGSVGDDPFDEIKKWSINMYEKIKPFVLAHRAALVIAGATIVICVWVMLAFNRYEFMNVNGNLVKVDRLTGEAMSSIGGRTSFRVIENYDDVEKRRAAKR